MGQKDNHVMEKEQRREAKQDLVVLMHQESPGKRQEPLWEFTSADPLPIAGCKECSHGERPRSSIGDMGIQLNCEKPYSNGWLRAFRANPQMPSREVQAALQEQFDIYVSIGHLNRVRGQLGIENHRGRSKKNRGGRRCVGKVW